MISGLAKRGIKGNTYKLPEVYFIGVLEFEFEQGPSDKYFYDVALLEKETKELFYDKLGFKFLVIPNFKKEEAEVMTYMDQWMYTLKNLSKFHKIPCCLDIRVFGLILDIGKVANLKREDMISYKASLKRKRDVERIRMSLENKGREDEKRAIALKMKEKGIFIENISEMTGLSLEEINYCS